MAKRGPLPIPHARRRNKRLEVGKPVRVAAPPMPASLKGEAVAEWQRVVPELEAIGVINTVDRATLIRYCTAWAEWEALNKKLKKEPRLVRGRLGDMIRNPLWSLRGDAERTVLELGKELTLTPNARLRAGLKHEEPTGDEGEARVTAIEEYKKALVEG